MLPAGGIEGGLSPTDSLLPPLALFSLSRGDLQRLSIALLQNEMPVPKPVRLLGFLFLHCKATTRRNRNLASRCDGRSMIRISRSGSMRSPVVVGGGLAFKFARDARGRASNLYEAKLYRTANATRRALLCPVLWVSRKRLLADHESGAAVDRHDELGRVHGCRRTLEQTAG
jgi:hypothetical protein